MITQRISVKRGLLSINGQQVVYRGGACYTANNHERGRRQDIISETVHKSDKIIVIQSCCNSSSSRYNFVIRLSQCGATSHVPSTINSTRVVTLCCCIHTVLLERNANGRKMRPTAIRELAGKVVITGRNVGNRSTILLKGTPITSNASRVSTSSARLVG
jgi:hypothetical protein